MHHPDRQPRRAEAGADLHQAPGIARRHDLGHRSGRGELSDLGVQHGAGHRRLQHRVDARAAAALVGAGQQAEPEPGDGREHRERRRLHALRVLQVAGRVVRDVERQGAARTGPAAASSSDTSRTLAPKLGRGLGAEQVAVVLEQRAAAGAVDDDVVGRPERRDVLARQRFGARRGRRRARAARRSSPGPATSTTRVAVGLERAAGGVVDVAEEGVHDAAAEEGDGAAR